MSTKPYIDASKIIPELNVRVVLLGAVLSVILAGANAYLGLFAGMTVSASIPAAVISMGVLKLLGNNTILENNAVQTAASAGESLAAGAIFTLPALVLMGYWDDFNVGEVFLITATGGILGVMFTIPLRSALIVRQKLKFPEGVATAEVLKTGDDKQANVGSLVVASLLGALVKFGESGMNLWSGAVDYATTLGDRLYLYVGTNVAPALMAVGYIVGFNISVLVFIGGAISWWVAIPLVGYMEGIPAGSIDTFGPEIWDSQIRYLGVGAMLIGGLWAIVSVRSVFAVAFSEAMSAFKKTGEVVEKIRTEYDTPTSRVLLVVGVMLVPVFAIYYTEMGSISISVFMTVLMVLAGFLFSAVAGYMAGLVGSSSNPISGVTIATILSSALLLLVLLGTDHSNGAAASILIGAVVCCAAAIAGDNMQDLKSGHLLGATPWRQQIMQVVGVVAAAIALPLILSILNSGYGFGSGEGQLAAPQATLMKSVADGVFNQSLPWTMVIIGAGIGLFFIVLDELLKRRKAQFRTPVLAVAVGIYLPLELDVAIFLGGLVALLAQLRNKGKEKPARKLLENKGLLFAAGLITGEAIMGILLAIPAAAGNKAQFYVSDTTAVPVLGLAVLFVLMGELYKRITR